MLDSNQPPYALTLEEYEAVGALAEVIIPSGDDPSVEPGANEVGVKSFFDSTFYEMPESQQTRIRGALGLIEAMSRDMFDGRRFRDLSFAERDRVLKDMLSKGDSKQLFVELRAICVSGFYSDYRDPGYAGMGAWEWMDYGGKRITGIKKDWSFLRVYLKDADR